MRPATICASAAPSAPACAATLPPPGVGDDDATDATNPRQRLAALHGRAHLVLEHHLRLEVAQLNVPRRGLEQRALRHESDDLAPRRRHALRLGLHLHHVVGAVERRLLGVDEIHRHLRLAVDLEAEPLHVAQTAGRAAHGLRDVLGDGEVRRRAEVDVVRDEKRPRADRGGAGGRVNARRAEVGLSRRGAGVHLVANALELAAADVGEVLARGRGRRALVEEDGNLELACRRARRAVRARTMQSSIVVPSSGMNGTTSVAPMRGCSPVW